MNDIPSQGQPSWSERLFLRVNKLVGVSKSRDRYMYVCAHWLIYAHVGIIVLWAIVVLLPNEQALFHQWLWLTVGSFVCSLLLSYGIAFIWHHDRPIIERPQIKSLLKPLFTWKSFPSDHTITVTVTTLAAYLSGAPLWLVLPLLISTCLVPIGRVYVGVHYPRDIVGGLTIGILCTIAIYVSLV